jgi:hypothetical protein
VKHDFAGPRVGYFNALSGRSIAATKALQDVVGEVNRLLREQFPDQLWSAIDIKVGMSGHGSRISFRNLADKGESCVTLVLGKDGPMATVGGTAVSGGSAVKHDREHSQGGFSGKFLIVVTAYLHRSTSLVNDLGVAFLNQLEFPPVRDVYDPVAEGGHDQACSVIQSSLEDLERQCRPTHLESEDGIKPGDVCSP